MPDPNHAKQQFSLSACVSLNVVSRFIFRFNDAVGCTDASTETETHVTATGQSVVYMQCSLQHKHEKKRGATIQQHQQQKQQLFNKSFKWIVAHKLLFSVFLIKSLTAFVFPFFFCSVFSILFFWQAQFSSLKNMLS